MNERYSGELFLIEKELLKNEGSGEVIFVQDCGDLFASSVPAEWIEKVLKHLCDYPDNTYLFQTKNPMRFFDFMGKYPPKKILGTTLESNRDYQISKAPSPFMRHIEMKGLSKYNVETMISIEPVMDFDLEVFTDWIREINPKFVSVGADSKFRTKLEEPSKEKLERLVVILKTFTEVKNKDNLKRLMQ